MNKDIDIGDVAADNTQIAYNPLHFIDKQIQEFARNHSAVSDRYRGLVVHKHNGKLILMRGDRIVIPYDKINAFLQRVYDNPVTGLKSGEKLWELVKEKFIGITKDDVLQFVKNLETTQLHKPRVKAAVNKPIIPSGPKSYGRLISLTIVSILAITTE